MTNSRLSQHPIDILIRRTISSEREAVDGDIEQIVEHIANAPFNPDTAHVPRSMRGLVYLGETLTNRAPSVLAHLVKRVLVESQWSEGTTIDNYVDDLRRGVRHESTRLALFARRGGSMVVTLAMTEDVVPVERRGTGKEALLVVAYSADRGIIASGYQASGFDSVVIPGDALWLK